MPDNMRSLGPPYYSRFTRARIENARHRARSITYRHAWYVGHSEYTGVEQYMVMPSDPKAKSGYWPSALPHGREGGYCYSLDGAVVYWIRCTCEAFVHHTQPCWHAAKVQLALERKHGHRSDKEAGL